MQESAEKKLERVVSLLTSEHNRIASRKKLLMILAASSVALVMLLLMMILEQVFYLSSAAKVLITLSGLVSALFFTIRLSKKQQLTDFSTFYESFFRDLNEIKILSAVDLYLDDSQKRSVFYDAALKENLKQCDPDTLQQQLKEFRQHSFFERWLRPVTGLFTLSAVSLILFSVTNQDAALRALQLWHSFTPPNPFSYSITPADTTVEHGTPLSFAVQFENNSVPERVIFQFKTGIEEQYRERSMVRETGGRFFLPEMTLTSDISFRIRMDQFSGQTYRIEVQQLPRFDDLEAVITFPDYTALDQQVIQYPFTTISLFPGSDLMISGLTNKPVESVQMENRRGITDMNQNPEEPLWFHLDLQPVENDTLRFILKDVTGLKNRNPFRTLIQMRQDQYPLVVIREPSDTITDESPRSLSLSYQISDDFGLTRAQLRYELTRAFVNDPITGTLPLNPPVNDRVEQYEMDLEFLNLRPRDQLEVRIRAWDNDQVSGPKFSDSRPVLLRVPSLAEAFDELDSSERDLQTELDQISENFSQMEEEYRQFLERMMRNPDGGFEEEQLLENVRERQEEISESVKRLNEQFDELRNRMENSSHVSEETRRAYDELQQLMQELDDPDLLDAIRALQEALQSMSQQELERAMENLSFNENLYRERLQRTAELFRQLKMNSDLSRLATQYEEMAARLEEARDEPETLMNELKGMEEDFGSLEELLKQLDSNPPRRAEERLRRMREEAERELESIRRDSDELSEEVTRELESGNESGSGELDRQRDELQNRLSQEAERFRSAQQQISGQQIQVNILALQQALSTLLEISEMQEFLTLTATETRTRSQGFVDLARIQNNLRSQFTRVADTLFQVSAELPGIPNQINRKKSEVDRTLNRSLEQMVERNQRGSSLASRESLGGINDLASMIANLIEQIQNQQDGGFGSGMSMQQMIEQLQNMSGNQQMLNQQLQDLINDAQGERLTREQSERLDQLARQQNEIRRQLQELQQSGALRQGDRTLSDLQRAMEEMEDAINDMRGGVADPLMNRRQQNILSRMLTAEESLQQRGEDEEREGTTPDGFDRTLPPDFTLQELYQEIRSRLQDPTYTRFSPEYQRLIERYFDRLRELEESILE